MVGAGPVGSLLSIFLAKRGFEVEVFERRPDMRVEQVSAGRSINLALSTRGLHALKQIGLADAVLEQAVPMRGRMIHAKSGELAFQPYGRDESQYINSVSRAALNKTLMNAAEATGRVSLRFSERVAVSDLDRWLYDCENQSTGEKEALAEKILIGTDGSASAMRHGLINHAGGVCKEEFLDYGYKELSIGPAPDGGFAMEKNALHIWPRGTFMLIALPNFDGSYTLTLFLPFEGPVSFAALNDAEQVEAFFAEHFPDAKPLVEDLTETFFANPTGHMTTVKCSPWYSGRNLLLVGDAAHAIVPFFGQGMNCGFEDCTVLDQLLERKYDGNTSWHDLNLFAEFMALRKTNCDAIADMAVENFVEMRDKVGNARFLMEKAVEKILQNAFPGKYFSRYSLVTFSRVPYRVAFDAGLIVDEILAELCKDITHETQVDLECAERLIITKLTPFLSEHAQQATANIC
jgi:kynurenine 3-monooxygenase